MTEPGQDGWHELWGTFSVRDHCRPGGFIPEVLIYDRLVLPVVPTADDLEFEARALGQDPKRLAASEWERWITEGWDPARHKRSIAAAVEEMKQLVHGLETATSLQRRWTWTKRCFTVVGAATTVAGALLDPQLGAWVAGGSAAATIGTLIADERAPKPAPGVPAATLVLDARSKLGIGVK